MNEFLKKITENKPMVYFTSSSDKSFITLFSYLMVRRVEVHIGQSVGGLVVGGEPGQAQV